MAAMKTKTISLAKGKRVEEEIGLRLSDDDNYVERLLSVEA